MAKAKTKKQNVDPVSQVMTWIIAGATERDIRASIAEHFPKLKADSLIASVMEDLEKSGGSSPDVILGWCFEASRDLYRRMVEAQDFAGALRAVKQIAELTRNVQIDPEDETARELPATQGSQPN